MDLPVRFTWFSNDVELLSPTQPGDEIELRVRVARVRTAMNVVILF